MRISLKMVNKNGNDNVTIGTYNFLVIQRIVKTY